MLAESPLGPPLRPHSADHAVDICGCLPSFFLAYIVYIFADLALTLPGVKVLRGRHASAEA